MSTKVTVRIKRGQAPTRARAAGLALERAGYRQQTVRRDGHPVQIWVL